MIRRAGIRPATCLLCQWRSFSISSRVLADKPPTPPAAAAAPQAGETEPAQGQARPSHYPLANVYSSVPRRNKDFVPVPLPRPIGMNTPPRVGENAGKDTRTLKQRRDDMVNWEKHVERREQLKSTWAKPYFRDWTNVNYHRGKLWIAPARPFKADLSLYFPNLHGRTLSRAKDARDRDTTPTLAGKASVVCVFSTEWAKEQVETFVSAAANPELHAVMAAAGDARAQMVHVHIEEDYLKRALVWLLQPFIRRTLRGGERYWDRYFVVNRGVTPTIREAIGILNERVGYVYVVDPQCRIRWAGNGPSQPEERESLVKALQRVLKEMETEPLAKESALKEPAAQPAVEGA